MTRAQMPEYLNRTLSSGNAEVGLGRNFGLGSKITGLYNNPFGLVYDSLDADSAHRLTFAHLHGSYGIDAACADGHDGVATVGSEELHPIILRAGHGTQVCLKGRSATD